LSRMSWSGWKLIFIASIFSTEIV